MLATPVSTAVAILAGTEQYAAASNQPAADAQETSMLLHYLLFICTVCSSIKPTISASVQKLFNIAGNASAEHRARAHSNKVNPINIFFQMHADKFSQGGDTNRGRNVCDETRGD